MHLGPFQALLAQDKIEKKQNKNKNHRQSTELLVDVARESIVLGLLLWSCLFHLRELTGRLGLRLLEPAVKATE